MLLGLAVVEDHIGILDFVISEAMLMVFPCATARLSVVQAAREDHIDIYGVYGHHVEIQGTHQNQKSKGSTYYMLL